MLRSHRVCNTSDFYLYVAIVDPSYDRNMFFVACVYGIRNEFLHLFTAAYDFYARIHNFVDYIAAYAAFVEFCCHNI